MRGRDGVDPPDVPWICRRLKELAARGDLNERDKPYAPKSVASMLR